MTSHPETEIARMQGEIAAIETRIDRAWDGIKADLKRQEWLRQQIVMRRAEVEARIGGKA